jgi:phosphatidylserine/phosphatidylglycerophosphate/cardiolipin synthase-like enzyme
VSVLAEWFLTSGERGNPDWDLPAWSEGNQAEVLIHGASYFDRLVTEVEQLGDGDHLFFADWRGDADQRLREDGPTVAELFRSAAERGVRVKGLMWRSYPNRLQFNEEQNRHLAETIERAGGEVLLDQRVLLGGSHHQRLVLLRRPADPERDVAFIGGIDLCHSRRDDESHRGDPQAVQMSRRYGDRPPWHDVQLQVRGPVIGALDTTFRERWTARAPLDLFNPLAWLRDRFVGGAGARHPLPEQPPDPPPCGAHAVQVLRTYGDALIQYEFAKDGERTIARGYTKAIRRARRLIYLEDQYMWSAEVARLFADALKAHPGLHLVVVVPRVPDQEGAFAERPEMIGRWRAIEMCRNAGEDRVHVFDVENHEGTPVYVHAKVCVVDDVWASVGSDNFNRRSWTHDSELSSAILDTTRDLREPQDPAGTGEGARSFARNLRLALAREHLDLAADGSEDDAALDPARFIDVLNERAAALDAWHEGGRRGPRPPGRLREHRAEKLPLFTRLWATPVYRLLDDPDGRPLRLRLKKTF